MLNQISSLLLKIHIKAYFLQFFVVVQFMQQVRICAVSFKAINGGFYSESQKKLEGLTDYVDNVCIYIYI